MRVHVILAVCLAAATGSTGVQAGNADEAAIRDVVKKYVNAREQRDPADIRALFTSDADQLTSSGEWRRGREALVKGALASSEANRGQRSIAIDAIRQLAPGVVLADGAYTIAGEQGAPTRNMRTSFVLVKGSDGWRISAIRNMLPAAR